MVAETGGTTAVPRAVASPSEAFPKREKFVPFLPFARSRVSAREIAAAGEPDVVLLEPLENPELRGQEASRILLLNNTISFVEGLQEGMSLTVFYLFKQTFGLQPATVGLLFGAIHLPFFIKPYFGKLVDGYCCC